MSLKAKEVLMPGIWIDEQNALHVSIPDLLDHFGWPHDEEHEREVMAIVRNVFAENFPQVSIKLVDDCSNCGASGPAPHVKGCPLA